MKRFFITILLLFLFGAGFLFFKPRSESVQQVVVSKSVQTILKQDDLNDEVEINEPITEIVEKDTDTEVVKPEPEQPHSVQAQVQLELPFIVQAPNGNWDLPYSEACEEASLLMVHHYYQGDTAFSQDQMKSAIDNIIYWGDDTFGSFDTNAETSTRYLTEKLGYNPQQVSVVYDFTIDDIKALLSEEIPVIVPAAGRELGNKFFQNPGPLYHMLVITGYTDNQFITNDPGTRRGEGYKYDQEVLYNAIHDLTPDLEQISTGRKAMIIIQK